MPLGKVLGLLHRDTANLEVCERALSSRHVQYTAQPLFGGFPDESSPVGESQLYIRQTVRGKVEDPRVSPGARIA